MNQRGYSLIEMMTVITIIGTLANIGVSIVSDARQAAFDVDFKNDVRVVAEALELYYLDHGHYKLPEGGAASGCNGTGSGIGFVDIKGQPCPPATPGLPTQYYDPNISIAGYLKREGYIPDNELLKDKIPPGIDMLLYVCEGNGPMGGADQAQAYAIYTSLYDADPESERIIDQGVTCGVWSPSVHNGANFVRFSEIIPTGLFCGEDNPPNNVVGTNCCDDGPGCN